MKRAQLLLSVTLLSVTLLPVARCFPANSGKAEDQTGVAAYRHGDYRQALADFRESAAHGDVRAEYNLGAMYYNGQGVPENYVIALKWYRLAAKQGNAEAEYNLGAMYYNGQGVPENYVIALKWCRLAAKQGYAEAEFHLGAMYYNGQGVPENYAKALKWLLIAKATMPATNRPYGQVSSYVKTLAGIMTPAQIAQAQQEASAWYAAHQHSGQAP
jgi:TPR repeat protein